MGNTSWEQVYEALQTRHYSEVLDQEFETGRYYELAWMVNHFRKTGDKEKENFIIELHRNIEKEEGRRIEIGDKFLLENKNVECVVEITDLDESGNPYLEFSEVNYKTEKKEIPSDFVITDLERVY